MCCGSQILGFSDKTLRNKAGGLAVGAGMADCDWPCSSSFGRRQDNRIDTAFDAAAGGDLSMHEKAVEPLRFAAPEVKHLCRLVKPVARTRVDN
jgi:hypothetical protein